MKEYLAFPNGKHDDQIDALSQFLSWQGTRPWPAFDADFGSDDDDSSSGGASGLGAPSPEELLWWLRR